MLRAFIAAFLSVVTLLVTFANAGNDDEIKQAMTGNMLAISPSDKVATTWADMKRRAVAP